MTGHVYKKKRRLGEERVIMHEGDASSSVTSCESDHQRHRSVRSSLSALVYSARFQVIIVSMVVLNCLVVIVEVLINLQVVQLGQQDRTAADVLHHINIAILGLFVVEMAVKMIAWGGKFVKHKLEVFDLIVVLASFTLGLTLRGMVANVKHEADRHLAKERRSRKALEREVYKLREYCLQQECELQVYRTMLQQNGLPQPTVLRAPPAPRTLNVVAEVNEHGVLQQSTCDTDKSPSAQASAATV